MENKNGLGRFVGGLASLVVGLFILFNRVHVGPAGWGGWGTFSIGRFSFPSGLVMVPFIVGVIWMFASKGSFLSKCFTAFSVLIIVAAIIMNTTFWLDSMNMFDWIVILVLIFGGGGVVASVLFKDNGKTEEKSGEDKPDDNAEKIQHIEDELNALKNSMDN